MNQIAQRILSAVQGDHQAISALANAVARDDHDAVRSLLAARGVALDAEEVRAVLRGAPSGGVASTFTVTIT